MIVGTLKYHISSYDVRQYRLCGNVVYLFSDIIARVESPMNTPNFCLI